MLSTRIKQRLNSEERASTSVSSSSSSEIETKRTSLLGIKKNWNKRYRFQLRAIVMWWDHESPDWALHEPIRFFLVFLRGTNQDMFSPTNNADYTSSRSRNLSLCHCQFNRAGISRQQHQKQVNGRRWNGRLYLTTNNARCQELKWPQLARWG